MNENVIPTPSIGRIVHYKLNRFDADKINHSRASSEAIGVQIAEGVWPKGAQAHVGTPVGEGDVFPAIIVRAYGGDGLVNLQVLLDGSDNLWVTSRAHAGGGDSHGEGTWIWPPRV